ncbi:MAG: hypothetical protein ACLQVM_16445 [Terriglobia bacterium]
MNVSGTRRHWTRFRTLFLAFITLAIISLTAAPVSLRAQSFRGSFQVPYTWLAAQDTCTGGYHDGNEGRNTLFGPGFKQWDLALYKDTAISERLKVQFRADFFNIVNHPNFTNPFLPTFFAACDTHGINPNNGACEGYLPTTATGDVGEGNPLIGGGGPRGIQLAIKLMF